MLNHMKNTISSVLETIQILEKLAFSKNGLTQIQLADELGITKSTTYRILQSLASSQWVRKTNNGAYILSSGLLPIMNFYTSELNHLDHMKHVIDSVSEKNQLAIKLSIRSGTKQVVIHRAEPHAPVILTGNIGMKYPVVEGSSGAALLIDESDASLEKIFNDCENSATSKEFLKECITSIKEKGYCIRHQIHDLPITAISTPIRDASGKCVASATILANTNSFNEDLLKSLLTQIANDCSL